MDQSRRHLRFSLRTLILLVTVAAVLSAIFAWWTRKEYRYASFADAKASCDRNYAHSGRVLIATWGDTTGPYRRYLGHHFNRNSPSCYVRFQMNGKRRTVHFATHDEVVVVPFENPQGDFLHLVYAKSKDSLTLISESDE